MTIPRTTLPSLVLALCTAITFSMKAETVAAATFSDVPEDHPAYAAVEYLKSKGILNGYGDGTFRPSQKVNRAEAIKILVAPLITPQQLSIAKDSPFSDVKNSDWFMPYVEWGRDKFKIVESPPAAPAFRPAAQVTKSEFIKMLLVSKQVDAKKTNTDITLPLAIDVRNSNDWFYPYIRHALSASVTVATEQGYLSPHIALDRGTLAIFMYRYEQYIAKNRVKTLLTTADKEMVRTLQHLSNKSIDRAEESSSRALLIARGALNSQPDEPLVKGTLKATEAYRAIVRAYRAGMRGELDSVIKLSGDAWFLAEKMRELSMTLDAAADQIQSVAKTLADEARRIR